MNGVNRNTITKNPENLSLTEFITWLEENPQKHMIIFSSFELPANERGEDYLIIVDTMRDGEEEWVRRLIRTETNCPVTSGLVRQIRKLRRERVSLSWKYGRKTRILDANYDDLEGLALHNEVFK